jgi:hypothetical protein
MGDREQIRQAISAARKTGYSFEAITSIGQTPSEVYLFSRLPEADQQAFCTKRTTRSSSGTSITPT